jgi:hypothetical protein
LKYRSRVHNTFAKITFLMSSLDSFTRLHTASHGLGSEFLNVLFNWFVIVFTSCYGIQHLKRLETVCVVVVNLQLGGVISIPFGKFNPVIFAPPTLDPVVEVCVHFINVKRVGDRQFNSLCHLDSSIIGKSHLYLTVQDKCSCN